MPELRVLIEVRDLRMLRPSWPCWCAIGRTHGRHGRGINWSVVLTFIALLCILTGVSFAQKAPTTAPSAADSAGSHLTVFLLTMGPGDMIYERFGHNAIIIDDRSTGQSYAFNYGIFAFDDGFIFRFLEGRMMYWMEAADGPGTINYYTNIENRSVWLQELNLAPAQRVKLWNHLAWNLRDENKHYLYNYYNNNCSTKVRDALDLAVGGAIGEHLKDKPTGRTYRWHTRRIVAYNPVIYTGLSFVLGPNVDREISQWDESFLPEELMKYLRRVMIPDDVGNRVPMISREQKLRTSTAYANRETPPRGWSVGYGLFGLLIAATFILLAKRTDRRWGRRCLVAAVLLWSLLVGGAGAFLSWAFTTEHWAVHWNENWLQFNPLALALVVLAPMAVVGRRWAKRPALVLASMVLASAVAGLLIQVLPSFNQQNGEMIALTLPAQAGLAFAAYVMVRRWPAPAPVMSSEKQMVPPTRSGR